MTNTWYHIKGRQAVRNHFVKTLYLTYKFMSHTPESAPRSEEEIPQNKAVDEQVARQRGYMEESRLAREAELKSIEEEAGVTREEAQKIQNKRATEARRKSMQMRNLATRERGK